MSHTVDWSKQLIDNFIDLWDWSDLSMNRSIPWNIDLINYYSDKVDFNSLSQNTGIKWTSALIKKFITKWNWKYLSTNNSLPWSLEFIAEFEEYWVWSSERTDFKDIDKNTYKINCLSANTGIKWTLEILEKHYSKIDFWLISLYGSFNYEVLERFRDEFNETRVVDWEYHKFSDFGSEIVDIYRTGWENLACNSNFFISPKNIDFLYSNFVEVKTIHGNFVHDGYYLNVKKNLLEILRDNKIKDFRLSEIIDYELSWGHILINDTFINNSLFEDYLWKYNQAFIKHAF
ncbi:MAG: hypothetical protein R2764_18780 [Bacteroidales bacterium]